MSLRRTLRLFLAVVVLQTLASAFSVAYATTYTWSPTSGGAWTASANWSPSTSISGPTTGDSVVFNNGATFTVTAVPALAVAQFTVSGNTAVTLQAAAAGTLTINGGSNALSVDSGSQLNVTGNSALTIALPAGTSGTISGGMTFTGATASTAHKLTATAASPLTFQTGATFTQGTFASGNAFGTTALNSVIFASGSKYVAASANASNPFGAGAPNSVVTFQPGSLFSQQTTSGGSFSGRVYADYEVKLASGAVTATGGSAVSIDNLTITQGTLNFNMTANPGHVIKGDVTVASGGTLNFNPAGTTATVVSIKGNVSIASGGTIGFTPAPAATLNLNGSSAQTLTNGGTFNVASANQTINVANTSGIALGSNLTIANGALTLTDGTVSTGANTLALGGNVGVSRTNGYVIGNLKKTFAATGSKVFEVGTANGYSPATANVTSGTGDLTVAAIQSAHPYVDATKSIQRYWTVTGTGLTSDLTFQYLASDVQGTESNYQLTRMSGVFPTYFAGSVDSLNHTATQTGLSTFGDFTVGEPDTTAPNVTSVSVPGGATYGAGQNLNFTVNFSEPVYVAGPARIPITLDSGTVYATYVSGSGSSSVLFTYQVANGDNDPTGIAVAGSFDMNGGTIQDAAANGATTTLNLVGPTTGVLVDGIAPTISNVTLPTDATYRAGQNLDFTVTFSENVIVTGTPSLPVTLDTGGTVAASFVSGSGSTALFRYTIASGNADTNGIGVGASLTTTGASITDGPGNNAIVTLPSLSTSAILVDGIAPTVVSINRGPTASPTNATSVNFLVTFSEDVIGGVDAGDFTLTTTAGSTTGTIGAVVTVNASTYSVPVTGISGDGTIRLDLKSSGTGITDVPGNPISGGFATGQTYVIDQTAPAVTSVGVPAAATYASAQPLDFTVNFGEAVTVTGAPRLAITLNTGGTVYADYVPGSSGPTALSFRYVVAAGDADPDGVTVGGSIDLNGGTLKDAAGNDANLTLNSVGDTSGVLVDAAAPTVVSILREASSPSPTNAATVIFTVKFSTTVTGVDTTDFALTTTGGVSTASVGSVTPIDGANYSVTANTGSGDGTIRLDVVNNGSIKNASNVPLGSGFTGGELFTIDKTAPVVVSVSPADPSPTNAGVIHFLVTFNESVTGLDTGNFSFTNSGVTGASVTGVSGSATTWSVTVNSGSGDGTIRLDVNASALIKDTAGNALVTAFTGGTPYTIDKTAPTVVSITAADATPTKAATIHYTVTFSEAVTGVNDLDFTLTNGGVTGSSITGVTGSGTTWTVTVGSGSGDGTIRLDVPATATIADSVGNALTAAFTTGSAYTIDKTAPTVTITRASASTSSAATVDFTVTFSESVTGVATGVFGVNPTGVTGASVASLSGSGMTYTVTVNTGTGNGTLGLDLTNGTAVTDAAGNPAAVTTGQTYTMQGTPSAPTGLTATAGDAHVALTWNAATDATSYAVKRATVSGGPYTTIAPSVVTASHDDTTATNGTTYYYVVTATGPRGTSANSNQASGTPAGAAPAGGVVISQVYGGGGGSTGTYQYDYVELFNAGTTTATLTGWSVQYGSATGNISNVSPLTSPTTIAAGKYLLIRMGTAGSGGTVFPVTHDQTGTLAMSANNGKVALVNTTTALGCGTIPCPLPDARIVDLVAYGTANNAEGGVSANNGTALTSTQGAVRKLSGCQDTNNNNADFDVVTAPVPRNSATAAHLCSGGSPTNSAPVITAPANPITTVITGAAPFDVTLTGSDDGNVFNWSATPGTGVTSVTVTNATSATATFHVTLAGAFTGTASFTASLTDGVNPAVTQVVNITVAPATHADVVVSQVFGGGGGSSGTYKYDYIELFNRGTVAADLTGHSIQYASGNGGSSPDFITSNVFALPSTTIPAGGYLLIQTGNAGTAGADLPVTADVVGPDLLRLGAGSGKIALVSVTSALGCGSTTTPCTLPDPRILDLVAWGDASNAEGGASVNNGVVLVATQGGVRKYGGCQDTNNNRDDFDVVTAPVPRNSGSPANLCSVANASPTITAPSNPITTVGQDSAPFTVTLSGNDDRGVYVWSATPGFGVASVSVTAGQSTSSATFTVTLAGGFYGTASFTATLSDGITPAATQIVNIEVTPTPGADNAPIISPTATPVATVAQGAAPFTVNVSGIDDHSVYVWSAAPGPGVSSVSVLSGQGTPTVTYSVTLNPSFSGTAYFTASLSDGVNLPASRTVAIAVTQSGPHIVISQVYGGGGNSGATYHNDFVELYNPTTASIDTAGWTIQYAPATNDFSQFQPLGGVIAPGQYYLIALGAGTGGGAALPAANITGSINMGASAGKVALVSNGDLLIGCSDVDVIDLVGYGSTANCFEGSAPAPAPASGTATTNTQSIFRVGGGATDTNQNGSDFFLGSVNPRQTAPITEIGPSVVSTDPTVSETLAPRDANITVNFSEPVDASTGWYNIVCASGLHNDATVASAFGGKSWIIVPNTNFTPGETCTVTVFSAFIHDTDLDDSAPNTDTLGSDYVWSFVVATNAVPPYPPSVHLTMGNPSGALADLNVPNNYLMQKPEYALSYNRDRGTPNWVSWHLTNEWYGSITRNDTFRADSAVTPLWYRVLGTDYASTGFDRGHMTPNADRDSQTSIVQATFLMTNMVPQAPDNNQGPWAALEAYLRTLADAGNELYIVSGPAGTGGVGSNSTATVTSIAGGHVTVPASTWKVVMVLPKMSGDDISRVTATTTTIAVNMPNIQGIRNNTWQTYLTTVDAVETLTGYDFFSNVPDAIENAIEAGTNGTNPPGAANLTVTATEDIAKSLVLDGAGATTLTYSIVTTPAHGALSGTGSAQTYTPVPDYYGSDSFTYKVNDGTRDSNIATVSINVTEVNDRPVGADDAVTAAGNTTLAFAASTLTANDSAGPNESAQTLTVTWVTPTAQTNGSVSLASGQISYTPTVGYTGPANFTYQVCDNGTTAGLADSLCTTATVYVTVGTPPPAAAIATAAGTPQTAALGTVFATPLQARVVDASGNPIAGVTVTFAAPASGPSGTFGGSPAVVTNTSGIATAPPFTANSVTGSYLVTASTGSLSTSFSLTNGCPAVPAGVLPVAVAVNVCAGSAGNTASAPAGFATYNWQITNGTITGGQGTATIAFTAAASGSVSLTVTTTTAGGCPGQSAAGVSQIRPVPTAASPGLLHGCPGVVRIPVVLSGTAPFTILWSDGFQQSGITTPTTSRQVSITASTVLRIISVTDASCTVGTGTTVRIIVDGAPVFGPMPQTQTVVSGNRATLTVSVQPAAALTWYEGLVGDMSRPVGSGETFTTPELHQDAFYWVRAQGNCAATNSAQIAVEVVAQKRRAVGHH